MRFEKINKESITEQMLQESYYKSLVWPLIYQDEKWIQISSFLPDVRDYYWISSYGRVYSAAVGYCIVPYKTNSGYLRISLQLKDGSANNEIYIGIHKLVAMGFLGLPIDETYQPNHIDSIRYDNHVDNLEWVTQKENVAYSFNYGNRGVGENSNHSIYTEEQVRKICELMQSGIYDVNIISNRVFGESCNESYKTLIYNIRSRKFWTSVSKDYIFDPPNKKDVLSEDQIVSICKYLHDNPNASSTDIAINVLSINIRSMNKKEAKKLSNIILNIKNRKTHTDITDKYEF